MVVSGTMGYTFLDDQIEEFLAFLPRVPTVLIGRSFAERPSILVDNRASIIALVEHLARAHGRRRIAFIAGHVHGRDPIERLAGYCEGLRVNGLPYDPELVYQPGADYDPFVGAKTVDALWGKRGGFPDGIVGFNGDRAIWVMEELARRGIAVPRTGFGNRFR